MRNHAWRTLMMLLVGGSLLGAWLGLCTGPAAGSNIQPIRYVATNGQCGINKPCYASIQAAVDAANPGDEVRVAAGRYTGVSTRNGSTQLVYLDKSITLNGGDDPQSWAPDPALNPTILDAEGKGRVLTIAGDCAPLVTGFHLVNGSAQYGGGVHIDAAKARLSYNEIYDNRAESWGGGVYLNRSASTLIANRIYSNTTGELGRGGGLALQDSPATVQDNTLENNRAHVGGAIEFKNVSGSGATLIGNTIRGNVAFDVEKDGRVFDGAGGGIDLSSALTDTVRENVISHNEAKWGGGIHAFDGHAAIVDNTIQTNTAAIHGGGLYIQGGHMLLEGNEIAANQATNWGGGLFLMVNASTLRGNVLESNVAGWRGGGMYVQGGGLIDGNVFRDNTATEQGGGAFLYRNNGADYLNNVFIGNHAAEGGGVYIWAGDLSLAHSTIAGNTSGDGRAVVIDKYPGLVSPEEPVVDTATVVFSNTIVSNQPVGFFATADNALTVDGVLWHKTPQHIQANGATVNVQRERTGDPAFQADGYHVRSTSAAFGNVVSSLDHDVDGHHRGWGTQKYLGADEYVPTTVVEPESGGSLTHSTLVRQITITVSIPSQCVTRTMALRFSPYPPLPARFLPPPFSKFKPLGLPFGLDPFTVGLTKPITDTKNPPLGNPIGPIGFRKPAQVVTEYDKEVEERYRKSIEDMRLLFLTGGFGKPIGPPQDPACGPMSHDLLQRRLSTPICSTGIITAAPTASAAWQLQDSAAGVVEPGYFVLAIEVPQSTVHLPLVLK